MVSAAKIGAIVIGGSSVVPIAIVSTRSSTGYSLFEENNNPNFIPLKVENAHHYLTKAGYKEKDPEKLDEFDKNRSTNAHEKFGLGCHKVLFEGKNVLRLQDTHHITEGGFYEGGTPISGYFGDEKQPLLGCSTSAVMNSSDQSWGKVYEFELAIKRGDRGFIERVSVWGDKTISQLIFYRKNYDPKTNQKHPYRNIFGLQRTSNKFYVQVGNPMSNGESWTDLDKDKAKLGEPIYFSIWVGDSKDKSTTSQSKGMMDDIGVRNKSDRKLFSSIAKAGHNKEWAFRHFKDENGKFDPHQLPYGHKVKADYTSKIAEEVSKNKGIWKNVKGFCEEQKKVRDGVLGDEDVYRLREYCYTNKR